ncbi:unnamed protein product [Urochloa humidicola]
MEAAASSRPRSRSCVARPLRRIAIPVIIYLVWVCLYGDVNLLAAAVPVPLPRRPRLPAVGYRPIPAGGGGVSSSSAGGARFGEDKRRIPSCPDALHNRTGDLLTKPDE